MSSTPTGFRPRWRKRFPHPADEPGAFFLRTEILFDCSSENSNRSPALIESDSRNCFGRVICPFEVTVACSVLIPYKMGEFVGNAI